MTSSKVAVIGSGLTAVATCKSLIRKGINPVVLDFGNVIGSKFSIVAERMSKLDPIHWNKADRDFVTTNNTLYNGQEIRKLLYGSDYFYGCSEEASIVFDARNQIYPPFSFAKGGFSVGWGASVLPPDGCDLEDWPVSRAELAPYFLDVLSDLPYSALNDGLASTFPLFKDPISGERQLSRGSALILKAMERSGILDPDRLVFGQSRLLVNENSLTQNSCRKCGCCMSGCVYEAIYKSNHDLDLMIARRQINYRSKIYVDRLEETCDGVKVLVRNEHGRFESLLFDRVFLAAGALNSTAIVMRSKQLFDEKVEIKTTVGFVVPMFHIRSLPIDWPHSNTMPGIFLEFKVDGLNNNWVHTQLSTPNELVFKTIGLNYDSKGIISSLKRAMVSHIVIAHGNLHSNYSNSYEVSLIKNKDGSEKLICRRQDSSEANKAIRLALKTLGKVGRKFGCYSITPLMQDSTRVSGYHLGGGLPMRVKPVKETDSDCLGRPKGWKHIYTVDSSVFPSIPGTTIGLLAMANAMRIAEQAEF